MRAAISHPNNLTLFRVAAIPLIVVLLLFPNRFCTFLAAVLFSAAAITDFLDGFLARKRGLVSNFGRIMDPVADKLLVSTSFIMLASLNWVPAWVVCIIIGRELAVMGLRGVAALEDQSKVPPSIWGKTKALFQFLAIALAMLRLPEEWGPFFFDEWVMLIAVAVTIVSAWDYFTRFGGALRSKPAANGSRA